MVVLDEHGVIEPEAMIDPAAGPYRVFLEGAQPRRRLARLGNLRRRALDCGDEGRRQRGNAAQAAEKIERRALAGEQSARGPLHYGDGRAGSNLAAVLNHARELDLWIEHPERGLGEIETRDHARLARHDLSLALCVGHDDRIGGDVARIAEILFQCPRDGALDEQGRQLKLRGG